MAQITYGDIKRNSNESGNRVGFFALKNNNDEAVVRFMHDTAESFDIAVVHNINVGGKFRNVNCIRGPKDPIDNCPLCAKNVKLITRIFIHLIEYVKSDNGTIVPTPKIWERPASFADDIYNKITEYGPLSNHLFKIKRSGAAGDKNTTYSINYCVPTNYPEQFYPNVPDAFNGFSIFNFHVLNKTADDMNTFLETGNFPSTFKKNTDNITADFNPTAGAPHTEQRSDSFVPMAASANYAQPPKQPYAPQQTPVSKPWESTFNAGVQDNANRPVRYY